MLTPPQLDDENKAKYAVKDCATHGLLRSFDVLYVRAFVRSSLTV